MKNIVFDFDDTLTQYDTFFPFLVYANQSMGLLKVLKMGLYLCLSLIYRLGWISNNTLKTCAIRLFIYNYTSKEINDAADQFWPLIKFHQKVINCLLEHLKNSKEQVYVTTASLKEYASKMQVVYPGLVVYGSELKYRENKVVGLEFNNYKQQKLCFFKDKDIDVLYTDSLSDLPLARISKQIVAVNQKGEMEFLSGLEEFQRRK